jgi:cytochrome c-type biogenesis protein CcmH/NrfF
VLRWLLPAALLLALVLALWLFAPSLAVPAGPRAADADGGPTVHEVASELMCQCGCAMTVAACQESMECNVADSMVADIQRRIDAGEGKQDILNGVAAVYGEQVLAAPRKSGFSLTVWVAPFVAIAFGGALVSALVWAWVRRRPAPVGAEVAGEPSHDLGLYEKRVDDELSLLG